MPKNSSQPSHQEQAFLGISLAFVYSVYVCSSFGLVSSNDGSHFATARALVEFGTFRIGDGTVFALNDVATNDGQRYSNKPPGTGILAAPFYSISKIFSDPLRTEPRPEELGWYEGWLHRAATESGHHLAAEDFRDIYVQSRPAQDCATILASLAGVLSLWMSYRIARQLGASPWASLLTILVLGLGTLHWRYSTALFAQIISAALLMVQLEWLTSGRAWRSSAASFVWGLLVGASVSVEYQAAVTVPVLILGWLWCAGLSECGTSERGTRNAERGMKIRKIPQSEFRVPRSDVPRSDVPHSKKLLFVLAGLGLPILGLLGYHYVCFGNPLRTPVSASDYFPYAHSVGGMFSGDAGNGLYTLFCSRRENGLLSVSPIVLLSFVGWFYWPRERWRILAVFVLVALSHSGLMLKVVAPTAGTLDHRYLLRILPILVLPLGFFVDLFFVIPSRILRWVFAATLGVLLLLSLARSCEMVASFMKHQQLLLITPQEPSTTWERFSITLDAALPSRHHWPLLLLAAIEYVIASIVAWWVLRRWPRQAP